MMAPKRNLRSGSRAGPKQNSNRTPPPSIETLKDSGSEFEDDEGEQSDDDAFNDHVSEKEPSDDDKQASEESDEDTKSDHESNQAEDDDVASDEETAEIESDGEIKHGGKVTNKKVSEANANAVKASGDNFTWRAGIDGDTEPFDTIEKMYQDLLRKSQEDPDFNKFLDSGKVIRIATMCSGTECPIIALELIEELLANDEKKLQHEQCFSAEIVPFKQAYIRRNWPQVTIFRDIVELAQAVNPGPETSEQEQEAKRAKTSKAARQQLKVPEGTTAYGSKAPVPGSLDILVAGFCCVDFSRLNNKKLTLEQRGESGDTLFAILAFIEKQRPKLVLLENVLSAPWTDEKVRKKHLQDLLIQEKVKKPSEEKLKELQDRIDEGVKNHFLDSGIDKLMLEIGYLAKYVILDAKDYYMPHTRERGYMLCVDLGVFATVDGVTNAMSRKRKPENKADQKHSAIQQAKSRLAEWENKVTALKHKATVPAEQLLMAATDTLSSSISHVEEANEEKEKERANHAWVSTKAKMEQYRDDLELGHRRRLTFWNEAGYKRLLDFWTPMSGMSQRVLDVLDICHLRNIRRGFDDRYYSRLLDLSQNVYRNIDRTRSGIIPCLTPSGIPWWTSAGRRIAGREALLLQGLPVDRIDLSYLTEANMQDLTGNAMTSTVVASAMLAAFATFAKELEGTTSKTRQAVKVDAPMEIIPSPTTNISPTTILRPISVERAKLLAKSTCQLCTCESSAKKLEKDFHRCKVCEHTVCTEHKGNCEHKYAKINSTEKFARRYPFAFIDRIKESIPRSITISNDCSAALRFIYSAEKTYEDSGLTVDDLESVLEFALLLKSFKRSRCWEITYESSHAKLVLEIAAHGIEWLLYAKSPTHLSLNDPRRVYRDRFPLARLRPTGDDITKGQWEIWAPNVVATSVNLRFEGKLIPSFESGRGLVQFANTYVFETFTIAEGDEFERQFGASIDGQYKLSPACGQAFDSLHLRDTSIPGEPPLFFMFDHQPQTGDPKKHYFVFTNNINKLAFGVHRQIVASLNSEFKYPMIKESTLEGPKYHITNRTDILAKEVTSGYQVRPPHVDTQAIITSHGNWTPTTSSLGIGLYSTTGNEKVCGDFSDWEDLSCKAYRQVFEGRCKIPKDAALEFLQDNWILVSQRNEAAFFGRFGYLFDRELVQKPHIEDSTTWLQSTTSTDICLSCAPKQPDILWAWEKDEQKPFEDLEHTADYEIALKERPSPIQAVYRVTTNDTLDLVIRINPETLVHRALSLLMDASDCSEVHSSWRLVTDDCSFYDKALVKYSLLNTADEDPIELKKLANESELRSEQIKTVSWAVKQEESPETFIEEEVVESRIPKLRYRLMGKAERSVVRRGGILASEVGYGKTAVVLALANHQKKADIARTKVEEEFAKTSDTPGLISIKATLILMPSHLVDQWVGEAKKFLPSQTEIIAIKTITSLRSKTIYEMQKADIIIMSWSVCEGPQYATALAQVAGMIDPDSKASPRAMTSWYQAALGKVKENVRLLRRPPNDMTTFDELVHKQIDEELANLQQNHRMVPSKRLTGSNLQKAKAQKKLQKSSGPNTKSKINLEVPKINHFESLKPAARQAMKWAKAKDWQYMRHLVLEMFKFSRIVVDEYHYASDKVRRSIMGISAHAKWLLSGTPLLDMFSDVKSMAELIGIKLGTHDYVSMPNDVFRKAIADMTEAEKFLVYEPPPSAMWIKRRDGLAQQFLNQFLRKDEASYAEIPTLTSMELVHQSAAERAAYIDVEYHLAVNEFRVPSGFKGDNDYDAQLRSSFFGYKHGEEALLWRAAQFNHGLANNDDIYEDEDSPVLSACDTIVSARVETYEELCNKFQVLVERAEVLQRHFLEVIKQQSGTNNCDHYIEFKRRINVSSDLEAKTRILELVTDAEIEAKNKTTKDIEILQDTKYVRLDKLLLVGKIQSRGKTMPAVEFYLRQTATELSRLLVGLVRQVRLIRLAKAISLFQKQLNPSDFCKNCQKSGVDIKIVWQCGHLVCGECMKQSACPADGCNATSTGFLPVSSKEFTIRNSATMDTTDAIWGSKIEKLLRLLEDIQEKGERVLLFVQDVQAIKMIEETLRLYNISVERLDTAGASKRLIEFNKNKTTVLILNVGGESAAGCNLTSANHIIFFSPYLTRGSAALTTYKAAMEQAIGRAKRFGQDKDVHIYHLLTSHTFDVDLFEERQNVVLVEETSGAIIPKPRDDWPESSCQTTYSSHLAGMVLERNAS